MLWSYEDENISITGNSSDIKYDAEVMSSFTDALCHDMDCYRERTRALERGYVRYHNNETFVGETADKSKEFTYEVQGDMHERNIELKKEFLNMCLSIENKFKEEVDPSPKARVSVEGLTKIKKDFNVCYDALDTKGYELECHAKEAADILGRWGVSSIPYYRRAMEACDEFCGHGKSLDKSIKKLENFDREASALIDRMDLEGFASDLQRNIKHTSGVLDSMTVYQPNMPQNSIGLVALSASSWGNPFKKFFGYKRTKNEYTAEQIIKTLKDQYGFTDEQAKLISTAYAHYETVCSTSTIPKTNNQKIHEFFSNLAALNEGYGTNFDFDLDFELKNSRDISKILEDAKENYDHVVKGNAQKIKGNFTAFNMLGTNPSTKDALKFFYELGVDGHALKEAVNDQHSSCKNNEKRDFVHECAILAVMSDSLSARKLGAGVVDDINAAIGYKGDVYSGSMGVDDIKSDVDAYNLYYRMKGCKDGDIWGTMTEYNIGVGDGSINGSKEFLEHFGKGDAEKGMEKLKEELDKETPITYILGKNANPEDIEESKEKFLHYVSKGVG